MQIGLASHLIIFILRNIVVKEDHIPIESRQHRSLEDGMMIPQVRVDRTEQLGDVGSHPVLDAEAGEGEVVGDELLKQRHSPQRVRAQEAVVSGGWPQLEVVPYQ